MAEDLMTDDEQLEAVKRWTAQNGTWALGGIVLGAALLFGWRYYDNYRNERDLKAAAQFGAMTTAIDAGDRNTARKIAGDILRDYSSTPYADQAELTLARLFVDDNNSAGAAAALRHVMADSKDGELKNIARLRLARVLIDAGKPDEALQTLAAAPAAAPAPSAAPAGGGSPAAGPAFAAQFHQVRGDALYAKQDTAGALREYQAALLAGGGSPRDSSLLQLKMTDLEAAAAPAAPATAATAEAKH